MIYVICAPQNKLDKRGRVAGWHSIPLEKRAKQDFRALLAPLKGKEVVNVISSDLDLDAANVAGAELSVPVKYDYGYRRFNIGRMHARDSALVDGAIRAVEEKWKSNPDVPIREGDSLTSYRKRFVRNFEKLVDSGMTALFVTDLRSALVIRAQFDPHALVPNGNAASVKNIFGVKRNA